MADNNLSKLNRRELLELLLQQINENESMKRQVKSLEIKMQEVQENCEKQLVDRKIELSKAGTMAEAAMKLNKVFIDADLAVRQYQENIKRYSMNAGKIAESMKADANREANAILTSAKNRAEKMRVTASVSAQATIEKAKREAEMILSDAQQEAIRMRMDADRYQKEAKGKMAELYSTFMRLQSLIEKPEDMSC